MKIRNVRALCSATKTLDPVGYLPHYKLQVNLDTSTGKLLWAYVAGTGYIHYDDPNIIYVCIIEHPATMAEIRVMICASDGVRIMLDKIEY